MERMVNILSSGITSFSNEDRKEYDSLKNDPDFWKLVDEATEKYQYNSKSGLLRLLYNLYDTTEDDKLQLNIIKFIYEMSVSKKNDIDNKLEVVFK